MRKDLRLVAYVCHVRAWPKHPLPHRGHRHRRRMQGYGSSAAVVAVRGCRSPVAVEEEHRHSLDLAEEGHHIDRPEEGGHREEEDRHKDGRLEGDHRDHPEEDHHIDRPEEGDRLDRLDPHKDGHLAGGHHSCLEEEDLRDLLYP
jgi:hypothetical protein